MHFRPRRSFHCRSRLPCDTSRARARWWCWWLSNYSCWDCISRRCSNSLRAIILRPRRSFHCRSRLPCDHIGQWARWSCWWLSNYPCWDCISRRCSNSWHYHIHPRRSFHCRSTLLCDASRPVGALVVLVAVQLSVLGLYLPPVFEQVRSCHIRPRRSFHCRSTLPCDRLGQWARWSCWWLSNYPCWDCISRRCSNSRLASSSTPDDHFTAGPHCRVTESGSGRVGRAGGCPTIRAGIVSPAGVQERQLRSSSTPDDHFTAGPHCRVIGSGRGRVGRAGGCPTIRAGIVSPAGVQIADSHHIHPRRSFHCRSTLPCDRLGQRAH